MLSNPAEAKPKQLWVNSLWRTATLCLLAGMGMHWMAAKKQPAVERALTVRGDALPEADRRLWQILDRVDFDQVKTLDALTRLFSRVGMNFDRGTWPTDADENSRCTLHLQNVDLQTAVYAVLFADSGFVFVTPSGLLWDQVGDTIYPSHDELYFERPFTRFYYAARIFERHEALERKSYPSTKPGEPVVPDGNWLASLVALQTTPTAANGHTFRLETFGDVLIITTSAARHRQIEELLRQLDKS